MDPTARPDKRQLPRFPRVLDSGQLFSNVSMMLWKDRVLFPAGKSSHKCACIVKNAETFYVKVDSISNATPSFPHPPDSCSFPPPPALKPLSSKRPLLLSPSLLWACPRPSPDRALDLVWFCQKRVNVDPYFSSSGPELDAACGINLGKLLPLSNGYT